MHKFSITDGDETLQFWFQLRCLTLYFKPNTFRLWNSEIVNVLHFMLLATMENNLKIFFHLFKHYKHYSSLRTIRTDFLFFLQLYVTYVCHTDSNVFCLCMQCGSVLRVALPGEYHQQKVKEFSICTLTGTDNEMLLYIAGVITQNFVWKWS